MSLKLEPMRLVNAREGTMCLTL